MQNVLIHIFGEWGHSMLMDVVKEKFEMAYLRITIFVSEMEINENLKMFANSYFSADFDRSTADGQSGNML